MILRGPPSDSRSDNGPEFIAAAPPAWIATAGTETASIEPGSPWENGCCEGFDGKLRDERLNGEIFFTLREAQVLIEAWRVHDNTVRSPAPEARGGHPPQRHPPAVGERSPNHTVVSQTHIH